jgi:serine/threonine protein kinase
MMYKVMKALNHCHSLNIIHRDIKPENIVFGSDNEPKLVDFGFAIKQGQDNAWMDTVGSPLYMAPEVIYGKYGKECDVWSLGVVIYQMLSGDYPFDGMTVAEINEKIRIGRFEMPKDISDDAKDLLDRMIEYRNDHRASFA